MESEFKSLQKRYGVQAYKLNFDKQYLNKIEAEAAFHFLWKTIILKDRRMCRRRLISLLHEICHAIQHKEGRFIFDKTRTRALYEQEVEAELFAIDEYEKIFACRYGTCKHQKWDLAPYEVYKKQFNKLPRLGFG